MTTAITTAEQDRLAKLAERVITVGNLADLNGQERIWYYQQMCAELEVNPVTRPFNYIETTDRNGNQTVSLYPNAVLASQLERKHKLSISLVESTWDDKRGLYGVKARAAGPDGRFVEAWGWVGVQGRQGDSLANQLMRAETKAFRRSILKWCGLALPDEGEMVDVPGARVVSVDMITGEMVDAPTARVISESEPPEGDRPNGAMRPTDPQTGLPVLGDGRPVAAFNAPTSPNALLALVNNRVEVPYDSLPHLLQALRQEYSNPKWSWPQPKDQAGWNDAYRWAMHHAERKVAPAPAIDEQGVELIEAAA